jgi:hypothetical protein
MLIKEKEKNAVLNKKQVLAVAHSILRNLSRQLEHVNPRQHAPF